MNNGLKMTVKILLIVMIPTVLLKWGGMVIINAMRGKKFQEVQIYTPTIKHK